MHPVNPVLCVLRVASRPCSLWSWCLILGCYFVLAYGMPQNDFGRFCGITAFPSLPEVSHSSIGAAKLIKPPFLVVMEVCVRLEMYTVG